MQVAMRLDAVASIHGKHKSHPRRAGETSEVKERWKRRKPAEPEQIGGESLRNAV